MPKKRNNKASNGHRRPNSKGKATPSPTPTPPATDINPAPEAAPVPPQQHEPNTQVEVIQPNPPNPPHPPQTADTPVPAPEHAEHAATEPANMHAREPEPESQPEDSTVLVERPEAPLTAEPVQLHGNAKAELHQRAEAQVAAELEEAEMASEIADELVELVESIADSDTEAMEAIDAIAAKSGATSIAGVQESAHEAQAVESILLNSGADSGANSTPATPPRSNGHASDEKHDHDRDHDHQDEKAADSPHPHLRRAASTSAVHKHLRFTSADEGQDDVQHHVYYPRKRNLNTSDPGTPSIAETAHQIRRTISFASFDNLVQLHTNPDQRERFVAEVARAGRELVWRDKDDHPLYPRDGEQTFVLASKRALRSFILSFTVRSGVNVVLLLFKTLGRRKKLTVQQLRTAIVGEDSWRFGAMIGSFTFLNTLTYHMLRLAPPASYIRKRLRAGLFSRPTFGPPEREGSEGEHRWHAAAAGGIASLALFWETAGRRRGVSQQMFVRGLQGAWNQYAPQAGVHIPFGNIVLFGLCCGQIMFGFLLAPETIPRDYYNWIQSASGVPTFAVASNRTAVRENVIHPEHIKLALTSKGVTENNVHELRQLLERVRGGAKANRHIPCSITHPWTESCGYTLVERFFRTFRFMLPVYGALHLIPPLVLRRHAFAKDPLRMLARITMGITRSCSFLGFFIIINQALFCLRSNALETTGKFPGTGLAGLLRSLLARKETFWIMGFINALSLFAEERKRRTELAMYVFPKALESAWASARKRAWVPVVPFGDTVLGATALAMVMDSYVHSPESLSGIVRRLLFQLVGPV